MRQLHPSPLPAGGMHVAYALNLVTYKSRMKAVTLYPAGMLVSVAAEDCRIPMQTNCTTNRPFIVQVVDSCGSKCTPNELQLPVETYTANLAPTTVEPVLVQYRVVSTFTPDCMANLITTRGLCNTYRFPLYMQS